ncbi:hypothetical protein B0T26DRAFT_755084 [Lasiosphaeria miniovina]|uniref:Uncharacterized protein n=1 Tax=Lasiosphaeria miniovina TaxID=1954250 RepID=A0AA40DQP8_9PEZI|nr:uncharacterized protein B0T26DRAFT_755084 [Lasiosphaeria miniovina]KAK0709956.1 hypothetical protein B0T26DRAFT_755084 [Lasiosphaeria miniovina]
MGINQSNPTCAANSCLSQVIGTAGGENLSNGFAQYLNCVQTYGSAQHETQTLPPLATYHSTYYVTVSTTDVVVEDSTSVATIYTTTTSHDQTITTTTATTTTNVGTVFTTTTTTAAPMMGAKKHRKKRGACKATSTASSAAPSSVVSSAVSSSAVSSAASSSAKSSAASSSAVSSATSSAASSAAPASSIASSSAPASSATSVEPTGPVAAATKCPSVEAYSSACSCIYAASDATQTFTSQQPDVTIWATETVTVGVPSVSTNLVANTDTVTVVVPATTTSTSTVNTDAKTTTTATTTTTTTQPGAAVTQYLVINSGPHSGRYLINVGGKLKVNLASTSSTGAQALVIPAEGAPAAQLMVPGTTPQIRLYAYGGDIISDLYLETNAMVATNGHFIGTCKTNNGGIVTCASTAAGHSNVYDCGSIGLYFAVTNPAPSSCVPATFKIVSV